jgi:hypothetical protein
VTPVKQTKQGNEESFFQRFAMICTPEPAFEKDDIWIVLTDANRTDWSFGKGETLYEPKLQSITP